MSFRKDNDDFEAWLANHCAVVEEDIQYKHRQMKESVFIFLRATYFRWARKIAKWCPELMDAPQVLAVGDLHAENFGTWRDEDGRLVWGVNDFDEAAVMPYALDLVRLSRPPWTPEVFRTWGLFGFVDSKKAREKLGYSFRPLDETIGRAIDQPT